MTFPQASILAEADVDVAAKASLLDMSSTLELVEADLSYNAPTKPPNGARAAEIRWHRAPK